MDSERPIQWPVRIGARAGRSAGWLVLWSLLLALPIQGAAGLLFGVLGSTHHHQRPATGAAGVESLQDFRRDAVVVHAAEPSHGHSLWLRHHHPRVDATVVALDDATQEPATDSSGSMAPVTLCTPTAGATAIAATEASITAWPGYCGRGWRGPPAIPLERPPRA